MQRDNLKQSTEDLRPKPEEAKARNTEAVEELAKTVSMESRAESGRLEPLRERAELDLIGLGASRISGDAV